jgi:hypothetical protein
VTEGETESTEIPDRILSGETRAVGVLSEQIEDGLKRPSPGILLVSGIKQGRGVNGRPSRRG